jgi:hypothetical protein
LLSQRYELLFPQPLYFHNHPHCPGGVGYAVKVFTGAKCVWLGVQEYDGVFTFGGQQDLWIGRTCWQQDARCLAMRFACGEEHLEDERDCLR